MKKYLGEEGFSRVVELYPPNPSVSFIAGITINKAQTEVTRLTQAEDPLGLVNFVPEREVDISEGYSPFDDFPALVTHMAYFPDGNAMVQLPQGYCRVYSDGSFYYLYLSDSAFAGACFAPWSNIWVGRYLSGPSGDSMSGKTMGVSNSGETFATAGYERYDIAALSFFQWAFLIEFCSRTFEDIFPQSSIGTTSGVTDTLEWHTGQVNGVPIYRGVELIGGTGQGQNCAGIKGQSGSSVEVSCNGSTLSFSVLEGNISGGGSRVAVYDFRSDVWPWLISLVYARSNTSNPSEGWGGAVSGGYASRDSGRYGQLFYLDITHTDEEPTALDRIMWRVPL